MSNLNSSVSESDLVDLFCAIGAIRDAKLSADPGSAIITFVKRAAAMAAITKYNGRELDKQKISGNILKSVVFRRAFQKFDFFSSHCSSCYGFTIKETISMEK